MSCRNPFLQNEVIVNLPVIDAPGIETTNHVLNQFLQKQQIKQTDFKKKVIYYREQFIHLMQHHNYWLAADLVKYTLLHEPNAISQNLIDVYNAFSKLDLFAVYKKMLQDYQSNEVLQSKFLSLMGELLNKKRSENFLIQYQQEAIRQNRLSPTVMKGLTEGYSSLKTVGAAESLLELFALCDNFGQETLDIYKGVQKNPHAFPLLQKKIADYSKQPWQTKEEANQFRFMLWAQGESLTNKNTEKNNSPEELLAYCQKCLAIAQQPIRATQAKNDELVGVTALQCLTKINDTLINSKELQQFYQHQVVTFLNQQVNQPINQDFQLTALAALGQHNNQISSLNIEQLFNSFALETPPAQIPPEKRLADRALIQKAITVLCQRGDQQACQILLTQARRFENKHDFITQILHYYQGNSQGDFTAAQLAMAQWFATPSNLEIKAFNSDFQRIVQRIQRRKMETKQ